MVRLGVFELCVSRSIGGSRFFSYVQVLSATRTAHVAPHRPRETADASCSWRRWPSTLESVGLRTWSAAVGCGRGPRLGWRQCSRAPNASPVTVPSGSRAPNASEETQDAGPEPAVVQSDQSTAADFAAVATHLNLATAEPQSVQSASEGEPVSAEFCEQMKEFWVDFYSAALSDAIASGAD